MNVYWRKSILNMRGVWHGYDVPTHGGIALSLCKRAERVFNGTMLGLPKVPRKERSCILCKRILRNVQKTSGGIDCGE